MPVWWTALGFKRLLLLWKDLSPPFLLPQIRLSWTIAKSFYINNCIYFCNKIFTWLKVQDKGVKWILSSTCLQPPRPHVHKQCFLLQVQDILCIYMHMQVYIFPSFIFKSNYTHLALCFSLSVPWRLPFLNIKTSFFVMTA